MNPQFITCRQFDFKNQRSMGENFPINMSLVVYLYKDKYISYETGHYNWEGPRIVFVYGNEISVTWVFPFFTEKQRDEIYDKIIDTYSILKL